MKAYGLAATGTFAALLVACQDFEHPVSPPPTSPGEDTAIVVTQLGPLVPLQRTTVSGRNLHRVSTVSVGGASVEFHADSPTQGTFTTPDRILHPCDVDGRAVPVTINGSLRLSGQLRLPGTEPIEVGRSVELTSRSLACLQLPSGNQEYAFHISSADSGVREEQVFRLSTVVAAGDADSAADGRARRGRPNLDPKRYGEVGRQTSNHFAPFQPADRSPAILLQQLRRLATAQVNDTIQFIDWRLSDPRETRLEHVVVFDAIVVAIAGKQVLAVDVRYPTQSTFHTDTRRRQMLRAAELVDAVAVPAIRATVDPNLEFPERARGRMFSVFTELGHDGGTTSNDLYPPTVVPLAPGVIRVSLNAMEESPPEVIAGTVIHELAHSADMLLSAKDWFRSGSAGWYTEALAQQTVETAARMSIEKEADVALSESTIALGSFGQWPEFRPPQSPWLSSGYAQYNIGARILLYAREKLGQTGFTPSGELLHQRLMKKDRWDIEAIAEEVGISVEQLIDEAHLAEVTDGLVEGPHDLPRFQTWENGLDTPGDYTSIAQPHQILSRDRSVEQEVEVASGSYAVWYIEGDPEKGLTIQATEINLQPHHKVRLTRLR